MGYKDITFGKLFGLSSIELTEEQLKKVDFGKLVECIADDPRADKIAGDKIMKCPVGDIEHIDKLIDYDISNAPYLTSQYNKCIISRKSELEVEISRGWYVGRNKYFIWDLLNKNNKEEELYRWIDEKKSIIDDNLLDFNWIFKQYNYLIETVINKVLNCRASVFGKMITEFTKELMDRYVEEIFKKDKDFFIYTLSNKHIPNEYAIKTLRHISGKKRIPRVDVILNKSMLLGLPSVMRLKALETLFFEGGGKVLFSDISTKEELTPLLFGTSLKYNDRVKRVVNYFDNYIALV